MELLYRIIIVIVLKYWHKVRNFQILQNLSSFPHLWVQREKQNPIFLCDKLF